jgi:N-acetylmuramoyl-L-alanine amidase
VINRPARRLGSVLAAVTLCAACGASSHPVATVVPSATATPATASSSSVAATHTARPKPRPTPTPTHSATPVVRTTVPVVTPSAGAPVIVIDPGHSPSISATDPATGLNVSDYENEPEMTDVFAVAELVRSQLVARGYRVVMTKNAVDDRLSLADRAAVADRAGAALALSIHDQAGSNGGIGFDAGNNTVYYQSVGTYRANPSGHRVYFTDAAVAALSKRYGQVFQSQRSTVEHHSVALLGNVGYDLGSRGLAPGDIWLVQLLSHVPWIYNEAGGNSAGRSGLDAADEQRYAAGLVAAVEHCIPPPH